MKAFDNKYLKRIVFSIQLVSLLVLLSVAYTVQLIPVKYLIIVSIVLILLLVGEYFLIFYKKPRSKRSLITQIMSVLLSCVMVVGAFYIYKTRQIVDLMTESKFQTRAISVIVLKDSAIKNVEQLPKHQTGYISSIDAQTMTYTIDQLKKDIGDIQLSDYKDFTKLVGALYDQKVDAIILDEAFRSLVEQTHDAFNDETRVIYQVKKDEKAVSAKNVDVTEKPFLVFISGNDEYGDLSAVSRSDVNMLVGVNPKNHQILLISIPRDTYYPLHMNG